MTVAQAPSTAVVAERVRLDGIDLLRGLAILLVVVHHLALRIPVRDGWLASVLPRRFLSALTYNGYEAVFVFFVISGFLITSHALARWGSLAAIDVRAFYVMRAARIGPCLVLLLLVLAALHGAHVDDYVIRGEGQSLGGAVFATLGLHLNWYEGRTGYLPGNWDVLWSLSIEEAFYLLFPLACLVLRPTRWLLALLIVLALSLPLTRAALEGNEIWQEKAYLPGAAAIATGVLAALLASRWRDTGAAWMWWLGGAGAIGLAGVLLFGAALWSMLGNASLLVLTLATACIVISLDWEAHARAPRATRGFGWLRAMGRASYEIYLTHMFVVYTFVAWFKVSGADPAYGFVWFAPVVLACWLFGIALARFYSDPVNALLRRRFATAPRPPSTHG